MNKKESLYYALGHLAYAVAIADGEIQKEEQRIVHDIVINEVRKKNPEMNISENYCDDDVMKSEQNLLRALNTAGSYMLKEDILTLYSYSDQSVILNAVKDTIQ